MASAACLDDIDWMDDSDWTADSAVASVPDVAPRPDVEPSSPLSELGAPMTTIEWREVMPPTIVPARRTNVRTPLIAGAWALSCMAAVGFALLIA